VEATVRLRKLKWLCRRGMKELDVLLEEFLQNNENELLQGGWPEFEQLLQSEDDRIWSWVQNPAQSEASQFENLLNLVRNGPDNSH
jgi:antitoxin CptB